MKLGRKGLKGEGAKGSENTYEGLKQEPPCQRDRERRRSENTYEGLNLRFLRRFMAL